MSECQLLVHDEFLEQYLRFQIEHEDASDSLRTQLQKSWKDPAIDGRLSFILNPRLVGKLYKLWIAGPTGYRYVYFHDPTPPITLPIFLSFEPRSNFNWDTAPIGDLAERIVSDFDSGQFDKFHTIKSI